MPTDGALSRGRGRAGMGSLLWRPGRGYNCPDAGAALSRAGRGIKNARVISKNPRPAPPGRGGTVRPASRSMGTATATATGHRPAPPTSAPGHRHQRQRWTYRHGDIPAMHQRHRPAPTGATVDGRKTKHQAHRQAGTPAATTAVPTGRGQRQHLQCTPVVGLRQYPSTPPMMVFLVVCFDACGQESLFHAGYGHELEPGSREKLGSEKLGSDQNFPPKPAPSPFGLRHSHIVVAQNQDV